ncbi:MAG TPA: IS1182 family transposase [Ectothiorhodospiraceae bacterium]|nr:IS1182 family transposase [Ectothiorhodospiraceae bacterium]
MTGYITGEPRTQSTLFLEALDDYIHEDNPVRVVDVFVDELNLSELGFNRTIPSMTGRPGYSPTTMLKLYLYGYLNRIQSSRRLERESQRNVELMWLTQRLTPDFKTIADFRKDNGPGIKNACSTFIALCRKLNMFTDAVVAVDGSKFKAVNSTDRNYTQTNIKRRIEKAEQHIEHYMAQLDEADKDERSETKESIKSKITRLKKHLTKLESINSEIKEGSVRQVSLTDPDCRLMKTSSIGRTVGYNVQTAVDTKHHMIVAHYVTNTVSDRNQICEIGKQAQAALDQQKITVIADKGYYSGQDIKEAQDEGMLPIVPKTQTSGNRKKGLFTKDDFIYDAEKDIYICPANKEIPYSFITNDKGKMNRGYISVLTCRDCSIRSQCTTSKARRVWRWEHEARLEQMEEKLQSMPNIMNVRKSTVEHPFGTIKSWMGATHFLTKRLPNVSTEISLHVLAYNMKRMMKIIGQPALIEAMRG